MAAAIISLANKIGQDEELIVSLKGRVAVLEKELAAAQRASVEVPAANNNAAAVAAAVEPLPVPVAAAAEKVPKKKNPYADAQKGFSARIMSNVEAMKKFCEMDSSLRKQLANFDARCADNQPRGPSPVYRRIAQVCKEAHNESPETLKHMLSEDSSFEPFFVGLKKLLQGWDDDVDNNNNAAVAAAVEPVAESQQAVDADIAESQQVAAAASLSALSTPTKKRRCGAAQEPALNSKKTKLSSQ